MIGHTLTQAATWKRKTGNDSHGKAVYAADQSIPCRWEWKRRQVRTAAGVEAVSEGRLFTTTAVNAGDAVLDPTGRQWTVLTVSQQYGLSGNELFREVYI